jgi:hypothetical protein
MHVGKQLVFRRIGPQVQVVKINWEVTQFLAAARQPGLPGKADGTIVEWLTDDPKVCPLRGVGIAFFDDPLFSIDFDVNNKFGLMWRRPGPSDAQGAVNLRYPGGNSLVALLPPRILSSRSETRRA